MLREEDIRKGVYVDDSYLFMMRHGSRIQVTAVCRRSALRPVCRMHQAADIVCTRNMICDKEKEATLTMWLEAAKLCQ